MIHKLNVLLKNTN